MKKYSFGVIGLGVMGRNLALNIENKGFSTAGYDLDEDKRKASEKAFSGKPMTVVNSLQELVDVLEKPRRIMMLVPAGKPVDSVIGDLKPMLDSGDVLIDGGNSFFLDTDRRAKDVESAGISYIGTGVSGGEEGALHGPSIMPGGHREAYDKVEEVLTRIAAQTDDGPCCTYIGPGGAGHYVKMVHNGIEYGVMALISESYDFMRAGLGMDVPSIQRVFAEWNQGDLNSFLVEITAAVLARKDDETGKPMIDVILDKAGQKGTGKWTSQNSRDVREALPTIEAAVEARILSSFKDERVAASKVLRGPGKKFEGNRERMVQSLREALRVGVISAYAQGFALLREASKEYSFNLNYPEIARIWKGGCIIRSKLLDPIKTAFASNHDLPNLLVDPNFSEIVNENSGYLRAVVGKAVELGVPCLAFASALGYIDNYRRSWVPANMIQALRDYFGAHTYERVDRPRGKFFHTQWQQEKVGRSS